MTSYQRGPGPDARRSNAVATDEQRQAGLDACREALAESRRRSQLDPDVQAAARDALHRSFNGEEVGA